MKRIAALLFAAVIVIGAVCMLTPQASAVMVTDSKGLNIRSGPGTNYDLVGSLPYGTQVTILSTQTVDGYIWGQIDNGWIRLDFTDYQESTQPSTPSTSGNWKYENGKWYYYKNGSKATGWVSEGGRWYYMDSSGVMQTGWVKDNGKWYYMNSSGVMQTGWLKLGAAHYYLNASGAMHTGWLQLGTKWYYMDSSGVMAVGKVYIGSQANKFTLDGVWEGVTANAFSSEAMRILKLEEGFSVKPYWDYSQWTVGYGTKCPDDMLDYYKANGIPEADAQILLVKHMAEIEAAVDKFIAKYSLTLAPREYDAVVLFSYNCGTSWCSETNGTFHNIIKNRATGNDLIRGFALWCSAGGEIKDFLVRRRLCEANMYLNGVYSQTPPANYCFVTYDANGGTTSPRSQGYDSDLTAAPYPVPTYAGYTFDGWYTAKTGGTKVTALDATHNNTTLYAHWAGLTQNPTTPETAPEKFVVTVTDGPVNVRTGPGVTYKLLAVGSVANGGKLTLTEYAVEQYSGGTRRWGKFTEHGGGWVCLEYTDYDTVKKQFTTVSWVQKDGKTYCLLGIEPQKGWQRYNNQWYYTNASGMMVTGWVKDGKHWYFMNTDGTMAKGWLQRGNIKYYLNSSGEMTVGWLKLDGKWYYFSDSGAMVTGWGNAGGSRYYFGEDGVMRRGWLKLGSTWYYLKSGGDMAKGWQRINGTWYYFNTKGEMATGWVKDGSKWYYMNASGAMVTGWLQLGKNWFYMDSSGVMATGKKTIGPVTYTFNIDGVWLG